MSNRKIRFEETALSHEPVYSSVRKMKLVGNESKLAERETTPRTTNETLNTKLKRFSDFIDYAEPTSHYHQPTTTHLSQANTSTTFFSSNPSLYDNLSRPANQTSTATTFSSNNTNSIYICDNDASIAMHHHHFGKNKPLNNYKHKEDYYTSLNNSAHIYSDIPVQSFPNKSSLKQIAGTTYNVAGSAMSSHLLLKSQHSNKPNMSPANLDRTSTSSANRLSYNDSAIIYDDTNDYCDNFYYTDQMPMVHGCASNSTSRTKCVCCKPSQNENSNFSSKSNASSINDSGCWLPQNLNSRGSYLGNTPINA
jgi:hypothetical protein